MKTKTADNNLFLMARTALLVVLFLAGGAVLFGWTLGYPHCLHLEAHLGGEGGRIWWESGLAALLLQFVKKPPLLRLAARAYLAGSLASLVVILGFVIEMIATWKC